MGAGQVFAVKKSRVKSMTIIIMHNDKFVLIINQHFSARN